MPLIKATNAAPSLSPFSLADIEKQAQAILVRAQQQADQLLAAAQTQAEGLKQQAHAEGLAAGQKEGLARGRDEGLKAGREQALAEHRSKLTQLVNALSAACRQIEQSRLELQQAASRDVIQLSVAIARRVTKLQGAQDPQVAVANVTEALKLVTHASDVRIAVHPQQRSAMEEALPAIKMHWPALEHVRIVEDAGLSPGSCRLYTQHGRIDADLDAQLDRVAADLVPAHAE
jgi:flagellar assembly protein FliH